MSRDRLILSKEINGTQTEVYEVGPVKELYIDGVHGAMANNGQVKFNFFTNGYPDEERPDVERREVNSRVVCSTDTFLSVVDFLSGIAKDIRERSEQDSPDSGGER